MRAAARVPHSTLPARVIVALALSVGGVPRASISDVPSAISYQGVVTDSVGAPLNGPIGVEFSLWRDPIDSSPDALVYQEVHTGISAVDGTFDARIGAGTLTSGPFSADLIDGPGLWLEVTINGQRLAPRQILVSVPYSLRSQIAARALDVSSLGGIPADGYQRRASGTCPPGSNISSVSATGAVTCDPDARSVGSVGAVLAGPGLSGGGTSGDVALSIANGGIGGANLAPGALATSKLGDASVGSGAIAPDAVQSAQIANGSLSGADIQDGSIPALALAAGAVQAGHLAPGAVTAPDLTTVAIGSSQVQDGVVYFGHLISPSVGPEKLGDDAVTNEKLALASSEYIGVSFDPTEVSTGAPAWSFCGLTRFFTHAADDGTNRYCDIDPAAPGFTLLTRSAGSGRTVCGMRCF